MESEQILKEINTIFCKVLEDETIVLTQTSTARDIAGWDSLNHAILLAGIQKHFNVRFGLREVLNLKQVGDICQLVNQKLLQ